jgi:nucleotide-binding universal stress UspA family protein
MSTEIRRRPVVAGVDGSPSSLVAAGFAAEFAVRHNAPLHLIYGFEIPAYGYLPIGMADRYIVGETLSHEQVHGVLATTVKQVQADHPHLTDVDAEVVNGNAAATLIEASATALATVVGCRGVGGFVGLLLGSVSAQVSAHGYGPIIVVRPPVPDVPPGPEQPPYHAPSGPVLVGVDRSPSSKAAVRFAVDEALQRGVSLVAVHAHHPDDSKVAEGLLAEELEPYAHQHSQLDIQLRAIAASNVEKATIDATRHTGLAVIGCRGTGGFAGLLLGSVSRALVHHAYAPVAVIHPAAH